MIELSCPLVSGDVKESEGEGRGGGEDRESKNGYTESEEEEELEPNFFNLLMVKMLSFHRASSRAVRLEMLDCISCTTAMKSLSWSGTGHVNWWPR